MMLTNSQVPEQNVTCRNRWVGSRHVELNGTQQWKWTLVSLTVYKSDLVVAINSQKYETLDADKKLGLHIIDSF